MRLFHYLRGALTFDKYYWLLNDFFESAFGRVMMLHFPFYVDDNESFEQRQINLIDHCLSELPDLSGKTLLEVGCGNGANCRYISEVSNAEEIIGIDLNHANLEIARSTNVPDNVRFHQDDAQKLESIPDNSVDVLISIESAFHYPSKESFFRQIKRVLKPGGTFLVADILLKDKRKGKWLRWWKNLMRIHNVKEEDYHGYADLHELKYSGTLDITGKVIRGYEGHRKWIPRGDRNWWSFAFLKLTVAVLVLVYINQLRINTRYMVFSGMHA
jgi:ubiquinone/menaquinone biosynthesis C-methylase UbiE